MDLQTDNYVNHSGPHVQMPGLEAEKQYITTIRSAFLDFHLEIENQIAEGEKVVILMIFLIPGFNIRVLFFAMYMQRRHCIFIIVLPMVSIRVQHPDLQPEELKGHQL